MEKKSELNRQLLAKLAKFARDNSGVGSRIALEMSKVLEKPVTRAHVSRWLHSDDKLIPSMPYGLVMLEIGRQLMQGKQPVKVLDRVKARMR